MSCKLSKEKYGRVNWILISLWRCFIDSQKVWNVIKKLGTVFILFS